MLPFFGKGTRYDLEGLYLAPFCTETDDLSVAGWKMAPNSSLRKGRRILKELGCVFWCVWFFVLFCAGFQCGCSALGPPPPFLPGAPALRRRAALPVGRGEIFLLLEALLQSHQLQLGEDGATPTAFLGFASRLRDRRLQLPAEVQL